MFKVDPSFGMLFFNYLLVGCDVVKGGEWDFVLVVDKGGYQRLVGDF